MLVDQAVVTLDMEFVSQHARICTVRLRSLKIRLVVYRLQNGEDSERHTRSS